MKSIRGKPNLLTATDSRKAFRVQAYVVTLMVAFSVMSYFDRTIMSIAGPVIMHDLSLSATSMGAVYTAFLMSYAVMNLPGGHLADRFGPRLVLTVMGLGAALFTGLTALGGKPGLGTYLGIVPSFFSWYFCVLHPCLTRSIRVHPRPISFLALQWLSALSFRTTAFAIFRISSGPNSAARFRASLAGSYRRVNI